MSEKRMELTDDQRSLPAARVARLDRLQRDAQAEQEAVREMLVTLGGPEAGWDRERQQLYVEEDEPPQETSE